LTDAVGARIGFGRAFSRAVNQCPRQFPGQASIGRVLMVEYALQKSGRLNEITRQKRVIGSPFSPRQHQSVSRYVSGGLIRHDD
jgi:hypothetical protein